MATVRVRGIKHYKHPKTGIVYTYHRKSGRHIAAALGSPEFFIERAELERASKIAAPLPGSLGLLIGEYMRSPDWEVLRPATKVSYEKAFGVLKPIYEMPLARMDRSFVFQLRDKKLLAKHGVWLANYTVTVLGILFRFAQDRGWLLANPLAERVKKIRQARADRAGNRPWSEQECHVVLERAPAHIRLPLAVAMCAGLRKADFLTITTAALKGGTITVRTSKRGVTIAIPIHPILADAIAQRPASESEVLCVKLAWRALDRNGLCGVMGETAAPARRRGRHREGANESRLAPYPRHPP